jgi:N-methylhydantoinase B
MRSTKKLVRVDGSEEWLPAKCEDIKVCKGDLLYFNTWGGGGWGDPFARDPELVRVDIERGLVSTDGAKRYGVVIDSNQQVDVNATEALRAELIAERGDEIPTFNFGGSIEEIKAASLAETRLAAPETPQFIR